MSSGSIESRANTPGEIDSFLSDCLRAVLGGGQLPLWPAGWQDNHSALCARVTFHAIAALLAPAIGRADTWPEEVRHEIRKAAALTSFWESSHREAIAALLAGFAQAGIAAVVTKGTALAYSAYPEPAMRRRGDSDILVLGADRDSARAVLAACGFVRGPAPLPLQEDWHITGNAGISHTVDVHWRINASAAISALLERGTCFGETIALPRLAPAARGMGVCGNIILTAINRHSHGTMGYTVGHERWFDSDRLVWAVDLALLTRSLDAAGWAQLAQQAQLTGTASIVLAGLQFAGRTIGIAIPPECAASLAASAGERDVASYFATSSGPARMRMDLAASPGLAAKARLLRRVVLPDAAFLAERFPDAKGWPAPLLHLRRWLAGAARLVQSKA